MDNLRLLVFLEGGWVDGRWRAMDRRTVEEEYRGLEEIHGRGM